MLQCPLGDKIYMGKKEAGRKKQLLFKNNVWDRDPDVFGPPGS
jgi:hypothetical protein